MACCMTVSGSYSISNIRDVVSAIEETNERLDQHNEYMEVVQEKLCRWAAPEYGDMGESWEKALWQAALLAVATLTTAAQISIANKRYRIAKDYANLAKNRWQRFASVYAPFEQILLAEIGNTPEPTTNYPDDLNRASESVNTTYNWVDQQFGKLAKKYALCVADSLLNDINHSKMIAMNDSINFNYRDDEYYRHILSDLRWNRRSGLLNLGHDLPAQGASYASAANGALSQISGLIGAAGQGATQLVGYLSQRRDIVFPSQFSAAAPLTGPSNSIGDFIAAGPVSLG